MGRSTALLHLVCALCLVSLVGCAGESAQRNPAAATRVVSFAPSITETLFALGLGNRVVGVTKFCTYPPEVRSLIPVGGYLDPNYEALLRLRPDLVILLKEHQGLIGFLDKNNIRSLAIDNESVDGILESFVSIANACGVRARGDSLADMTRQQLARANPGNRPAVLLCVGRDNPGAGSITRVFAAGRRSFYNTLIEAAGGRNCIVDSTSAYPSVSAEGLLRLDPDVIIDLMAAPDAVTPGRMQADWEQLGMLKAVRQRTVHCLTGDHLTIPGPRIIEILRDLQGVIQGHDSFGAMSDAGSGVVATTVGGGR